MRTPFGWIDDFDATLPLWPRKAATQIEPKPEPQEFSVEELLLAGVSPGHARTTVVRSGGKIYKITVAEVELVG